ncbi:hypothetical protein EV646_102116 [Kribbella antiqua]|uniref:Uncharacterized protein n=1 Tax=Kribbella antiqua TaxID=2512217 RepID=A0A4R2J3Y4_9ACTN|nr:hypothetical protein [Kribbella antiqua]TCO50045.1 hypothetical protein EV646_102116 [Kribbella antiqua]
MGLGDIDLPIDLSDVPGWVWLLAVIPVVSWVSSMINFVQRHVENKFWRESGKVNTLITFVLLVCAYAFYGDEQTRTLWEAVKDLGMEEVRSVLPVAITTQFLLLGLFWIVFGRILGMSWRSLAEAGIPFLAYLAIYAQILLYTVMLLGILRSDVSWALVGLGGSLILAYLFAVAQMTPEFRAEQARIARRKGVIAWMNRATYGSDIETRSRWARRPREVVGFLVTAWIFLAIVTVPVIGYFKGHEKGVPSIGGAIRVELIVMSVLLLVACFQFRDIADSVADTPRALFPFVDLSLAFAAAVVAVTGLPNSEVTLGPVPVFAVAVGPPLIVALTIFLSHLIGRRRRTHNWGAAMLTSVGAGFVVLPLKLLLTAAVVPLVGLLPLPSW